MYICLYNQSSDLSQKFLYRLFELHTNKFHISLLVPVHVLHAWLLQSCPMFCDPWTVAHHAPLSMGFSRQEYCSGLPCPPPGDLPDPGIKPVSLTSPVLAGGFFITGATWEARACFLGLFKSVERCYRFGFCSLHLPYPLCSFLLLLKKPKSFVLCSFSRSGFC